LPAAPAPQAERSWPSVYFLSAMLRTSIQG
jgi:hypothetical protein